MKRLALPALVLALALSALGGGSVVSQPATTASLAAPGANRADEPIAPTFSLTQAARFLDAASSDWTRTRRCFTCHTNYNYLLARPAISEASAVHQQVRRALEELVEVRWAEQGPRWDTEVVMSAAVLAYHDAATTGKLHRTTRKALDRMWRVQRPDGGFDWLNCDWPPMESDDHFGATMAAIAVGVAPDAYAQTPAARDGMARLRTYFDGNPPPTLHHTAMLLWAGSYGGGFLTDEQRREGIRQLRALQKPDGGWCLATLGNWTRADGKEQDRLSSDGYATGFVLYVPRRSGVPAEDPPIQQGVRWLKSHQRISGRWFTRSLRADTHHYLTHAGSAFAVMALQECSALPPASSTAATCRATCSGGAARQAASSSSQLSTSSRRSLSASSRSISVIPVRATRVGSDGAPNRFVP